MDITLHLGAHRCATTSFQHYMRRNEARLAACKIGYWGPQQLRRGLLEGVFPAPGAAPAGRQLQRARGRVALQLIRAEETGIARLIVSDENMIGSPRRCLRDMRLYPAVGERMARYGGVFGGRVTQAVLSIRSQDAWWTSTIAFAVTRGARAPGAKERAQIVAAARSWRDVITDLSCALPQVRLLVLPHENFSSAPELRLAAMVPHADAPPDHAREWLNRVPGLAELRRILQDRGRAQNLLPPGDGPWHPFDVAQRAALREAYLNDLSWLRAGADGLATLIEEPRPDHAGRTSQARPQTRGQAHDQEGAGHVAEAGGG